MQPDFDRLVSYADFPTPGVRAVLIQGHEGGWGDHTGSSRGLSNELDFAWMLANRIVADAIVVGLATAQREKYRRFTLTQAQRERRHGLGLAASPALVIATRSTGSVDAALDIADLVVTTGASSDDPRVITAGADDIDWKSAIAQLNERGLVRIICEGGPRVVDAIAAAGALDQLALTTSALPAESHFPTPALSEFIASAPSTRLFDDAGFSFELIGQLPDWQQRLDPLAYHVLRRHGTEAPFSVDYEKKPAPGYYSCRACGNRLFDASDQFDARCGWPAFWQPHRNDGVRLLEDVSLGMCRTEVRCRACDSHLGHVFYGEGWGFETDARYCINAVCLVRHHN